MAQGEELCDPDLATRLKALECHFNWNLITQESSPGLVEKSILVAVDLYNSNERPLLRFAACLYAAFAQHVRHKKESCEELLFVANQILEHSRDPTLPAPPSELPDIPSVAIGEVPSDGLHGKGSDDCVGMKNNDSSPAEEKPEENVKSDGSDEKDNIRSQAEEKVESEVDDNDPKDGSSSSDEEEESDEDRVKGGRVAGFGMWNHDRFTGMWGGAKHVLVGVKAFVVCPKSEVEDMINSISPIAKLSASDCALIRYVESISWECLSKPTNVLRAMGSSVLADPSDIKWYIALLEELYTIRARRHLQWGRRVEWKDIETYLDVIDSLLDLGPAPWIVVDLNFEKLQAINDYLVSFRRMMPFEESNRLYSICSNLCRKIIENTTQTELLAYCAQFLSRRPQSMDLAVSTIEKALEAARDHDRIYIQAKACNIFIKVNRLEDALACAESAAEGAFGSIWQVLEVKTLLGHDIDPKQFFENASKGIKLLTHFEQLHINAMLYYVCKTKDIEGAISHITKIVTLSLRTSKDIMGVIFCKWINDDVNIAEACYNVVMYVLNGDYKEDEIELSPKIVKRCELLKCKFEEKNCQLGRLTPKEYVRWLRTSKYNKRNLVVSDARNSGDSGSGENSFWPHQKYTQDMYARNRRSSHSRSVGSSWEDGGNRGRSGSNAYTGDGDRGRAHGCADRGNYGGGGGYNSNRGRNEARVEALSWRNEMRPVTSDDATPTQVQYGSSPGSNQPSRSWGTRTFGPDDTNANWSQRSRENRSSGSYQPPARSWRTSTSDRDETNDDRSYHSRENQTSQSYQPPSRSRRTSTSDRYETNDDRSYNSHENQTSGSYQPQSRSWQPRSYNPDPSNPYRPNNSREYRTSGSYQPQSRPWRISSSDHDHTNHN